MRVGLVCPYSLTLPGGVQGQVLGLGRALRDLGIDARVLGPCDGPPPDTFVTPLGNSIPTASNGSMAAGTPVVASDLVGYRNVARPDQDALLVPPGEPDALARALKRALRGGPVIAELVASGEQRAASFSLESLAKRYLDLYDEARRRHADSRRRH